ncbi:peptidoglycan DD-metalloendopeptidase family protein [Flavobacterium sp. SM15]|uniref:murein hydrolase activator EnvC family protein n=1 Tax=Flavobacterium sp. SM15 TaxID=2908005 RepID=UPI001EDA5C42|nr:peptidoglycan DD-metalloendopeptidase family protein [Flavobacterium sp. SM15]MCG2610326.1 peptidoglycan DD-metalloendopeptidase family protein [Flavobacterium sp. SM15]
MHKILLTILFFCTATVALAQNGDDKQRQLEERKAQIQKEIREMQQLLQAEKKKEKNILGQISQQNAKIRLSERLINTTSKQKRLLSDDIYLKQLEINKLKRELDELKKDYSNMIVKSYKSRSEQSRIMFVLSSQNFLQAYKRMQYMKQYASFRKMQGDEIKIKSGQLVTATGKLEVKKKEKEKVIAESEKEKKEYEKDKAEQQRLAKVVQKDKKKYAGEIKKMQAESRRIDAQIQRMIREAIAAANRQTKASGKTIAKTSSDESARFVLTTEGKELADNFKASRGRLPWPVEKGFVSLGYGDQPHPAYPDLTVHNSGVEITTEPGSNARAVFNGTVLQVQVISANNKAVYVQHGDYITVYLNLSSVNVGKGDKVSAKQNLGRIHTNSSGKAVMKFLVLQNTTTLNPQSWINNM